MANEIEIVVRGKDHTDSAFGAAIRKAKSLGDSYKTAGKESHQSLFGMGPALDLVRGKTEGLASGAKLLANPYVAATGAVAGMAAGALASGAALAGLGAGFIALGAMGVRESKAVQAALAGLKETANATITDAAKPLEKHFVGALNTIQGTAASTGPMLRNVFDAVGPSIENLADGVDGLAQNAMPGLERAGKASAKVLDAIGEKLPETGKAISMFGDDLAEASDGGAQAMSDALTIFNGILGQTGKALSATSKAYDFFRNDWGKWATGALGPLLDLNDNQEKVAESAEAAATAGEKEATAYFSVARGMGSAALKTGELLGAFDRLNGRATDLARSELEVRDSVDAAADALEDSRGSLDLNTDAGRRANDALLDLVGSYARNLQSMQDAGKTSDEVSDKYAAQTREVMALGRRFGISEEAMRSFIDQFFQIPTVRTITIKTPNLQGTKQQIVGFKREADRIKGQYNALVKVHGTDAAAGTINSLKRQAESAERRYFIDFVIREHRKVYSTTAAHRYGSADAASRWGSAHGGIVPGIPGAANGGIRNGLMMVGEYGRELVELPPGSRVHPNGATEAMMAAAASGGGGSSRVVIDLTGGDSEFLRWLRNRIRIEGGGNVQAALGRSR